VSYKIDKIAYTSQYDVYQMYASYIVPLTITGTIANTKTRYFGAGFTFSGGTVRGEAVARNASTGLRTPFAAGPRLAFSTGLEVYQRKEFEIAYTRVVYPSPDTFQVYFYIYNNNGHTITLIDQEVDILIDFYFAPID